MIRRNLGIYEIKTGFPAFLHQVEKGHLGSVGFEVKHRFSEKRASERHSVKTADKLSFPVGLKRMGVTQFMQFPVSRLHSLGYPRPALPFPLDLRAVLDDRGEIRIGPN